MLLRPVWTVFGTLGVVIPDMPQKALIYLAGAGMLWPLGLLVGSLLKFDLFTKDNPLSTLAGLIGGLQILFIPLMIGAYATTPLYVPWYLGVLVGAHFLPFVWVYDSRAYLFAAIATTAVAALTGWLAPEATYVLTPFAVVAVLLVTLALLWRELILEQANDTRCIATACRLYPSRPSTGDDPH